MNAAIRDPGTQWAPSSPSSTIGIDPTIEVGPVEVAWHGLTIAIGIVIGGIAVAAQYRN
jgi:prolipoprotein diacylglyceryltransferase